MKLFICLCHVTKVNDRVSSYCVPEVKRMNLSLNALKTMSSELNYLFRIINNKESR